MQKVGAVALDLNLNEKGFNSQLKSIGNMAKKVGATIAGAFAIKKVVDFGKDCIELGSDLTEVQNVVDVAFPKMNKTIDKFAKNAAAQFGLSETMAKRYAGTFGSMSKAFGFSEKDAAKMSETLTGLSGDVASFYNISQDEAYTKLKSVFTGETESLKDLGVVMTQTALDQFALQNGFGKTTAKMTEQEKVALRYAFVQKQLTDASGDFARTSDSWANQTRILNLQFESLKANIGQGLINVFAPVLKLINTLLAKLSTLASAFKSFTEMLTGNKNENTSVSETSDDLKGIKDNADGATSGMDGLAKSTKKAAKAANGLANFDNLNVMQQDSDSSTPGSGSGDINGVKYSTKGIDAGNGSLGKMDKLLSMILNKFRKLSKLFLAGFTLGLKSDGFEQILNYLRNIGDNLKDIFTDPKVVSAANNWVDNVVYNLGRITGSVASIGVSIGTMLIGGVNKFLDQNKDYIKNKMVDILDISSERATIWGNFSEAVADIFTVFEGDNAQQIVADVIAIFTTINLEVIELCLKIGRDIISTITKPIVENKDKIKTALENTIQPISEIIGGIKEFVQGVFESIQEKYDEYVKPAFDDIASGLSKIFSFVLNGYNKYIAPVLSRVASGITEVLNEYIKPMIDSVLEFAGKIISIAGKLFKFLSPIIGWFIEKAMPGIGAAIEMAWSKIKLVISLVSTVIKTIFDVLNGLIDFITGIFTGDWEKAWNGIKESVEGIFNGIKKVIKIAVTFVKDTIIAICEKIKGKIETAATGVKTILSTAWEGIKNVFSGVVGFFKKIFSRAYNAIKNIFKNPGEFFSGVWDKIKSSFSHVTDWFKNTFSSAWKAVKDVFSTGGKIFSGIKDGIASVFKTVVNGLIGGINKLIKKPFGLINGMLNKVRAVSVAGVKPFKGFWDENPISVPQIPKLAKGAVLKPNAPFLAMVGDQKNGTNIEAPLETIKQALRDVQSESNNGTGGSDNIVVNVFLKGDADGVFNLVKTEAKKYKNRTGTPAFN